MFDVWIVTGRVVTNMFTCIVCGKKFTNNNGGQFTNHLKSHNLSMKEYIVKIEYGGCAPKCACGLCNEEPIFYRGKFSTFAKNHNEYKVIEQLYVAKYGAPTCVCGKPVSFHRGKPNKFCSFVCSGKEVGFGNVNTKKKIKNVLNKKYGVNHVSQIQSVREKIRERLKKRWRDGEIIVDELWKENIRKSIKKLWTDPDYRKKQLLLLGSAVKTDKVRKHRSMLMKKRWANNRTEMLQTLANCFKNNGSSKLHMKIRNNFKLLQYGFENEVPIGRYIVDEVNFEKNIIIEIFGNYIHANPKMYSSDFIVRLPGCSYFSYEKWIYDAKRIIYLSKKGFDIFVIWEDDNMEKRFEEIRKRLE